jgi:acyl dehydratase
VRFTAPVYPGEHVETKIWVDGTVVSFQSRAVERDVVVLDHGRCELALSH